MILVQFTWLQLIKALQQVSLVTQIYIKIVWIPHKQAPAQQHFKNNLVLWAEYKFYLQMQWTNTEWLLHRQMSLMGSQEKIAHPMKRISLKFVNLVWWDNHASKS